MSEKKRKLKTKKEIEDKLEFYEKGLVEINERLGKGGLVPEQVNKLYDLQLQFITGVGNLKWVLGKES